MKKTQKFNEISTAIAGLLRDLRDLEDKVSQLQNNTTEPSVEFHNKKNTASMYNFSPALVRNVAAAPAYRSSRIIPFPGSNIFINPDHNNSRTKQPTAFEPYTAIPGRDLLFGIPDQRQVLQRDGLILLSWDKHVTEKGERFTAYWVTSTGIPRYYASKPLSLNDFPSARPDHKSYAAEDGIEFYGQKAPVYMVHVAPELMKSNPQHGELRTAHINKLKLLGSKVNFNHKFLLKLEKKRTALSRKNDRESQDQVG